MKMNSHLFVIILIKEILNKLKSVWKFKYELLKDVERRLIRSRLL